jgi:3-hydroxy-9,10-secoandrosta-1,3,5(10)-triene-9,17-dione monooxygenase reductase component
MSAPPPAEPVAPADLRRAASRFPSGVALVTAPGGLGLVIDSFISVSLAPPLVGFAASQSSLTWRRMRSAGRLAVNVLGARHGDGLRERARPGADRLAGLDAEWLPGDLPVLRDALAVVLCTLEAEHGAGDHTLVVARVDEVRDGEDAPALVFFDGGFGALGRREVTRPVSRKRSPHRSASAR